MTANQIPMDVIWSDIDYMVNVEDFTVDVTRFPVADLNKWLNDTNLHYVPIMDAGVAQGNNTPYNKGIEMDVFIKNSTGSPITGWVWPGKTNFVDWFHPNATSYWRQMFDIVRNLPYNFAGIWLDMNEVASFCPGECLCISRMIHVLP
jgi:alpha-glucosidase (family GH31 glycosyl hydrolase)